jgi:hypothetical protein
MGLSCRQTQWEVLGIYTPWASRCCSASDRKQVIAFLSSVRNLGDRGSPMGRSGGEFWAFYTLRKHVFWHPQCVRLLLSGGTGFTLFDMAAGPLSWFGVVWSSVGRKASWCQQNSKAWSLWFNSMCDSELQSLSSKLQVPMKQQSHVA